MIRSLIVQVQYIPNVNLNTQSSSTWLNHLGYIVIYWLGLQICDSYRFD